LQPAAWLTQALRSGKDTLALPFAPPYSGNERRAALHIYGGSRKLACCMRIFAHISPKRRPRATRVGAF